jgi:hypothetical protein
MRRRMKRCKRGCSLGWPPGKERFWPENASLTAGQHEPAIRSPAGEQFAAQTARTSIAACAACQFREGSYASGEARSQKCRRFDERSGRRNFDVGRSRLNRGRAWSSTFTLASGNQVLPNEIGDLTAPPESQGPSAYRLYRIRSCLTQRHHGPNGRRTIAPPRFGQDARGWLEGCGCADGHVAKTKRRRAGVTSGG